MKRILIQNGTLYDGLGGQPYQADLLVQDGHIAQIAPGITEPADQVIDATGNVIPGLLAAGEATGGVHGMVRLGTVAVADCMIFGRIAARTAYATK